MGQVRSLDEQLNDTGYLRLATTEPLVKHVGNRLEGIMDDIHDQVSPGNGKRLVDLPIIRKPMLWIYDAIFKLYH